DGLVVAIVGPALRASSAARHSDGVGAPKGLRHVAVSRARCRVRPKMLHDGRGATDRTNATIVASAPNDKTPSGGRDMTRSIATALLLGLLAVFVSRSAIAEDAAPAQPSKLGESQQFGTIKVTPLSVSIDGAKANVVLRMDNVGDEEKV